MGIAVEENKQGKHHNRVHAISADIISTMKEIITSLKFEISHYTNSKNIAKTYSNS